MAGYEILFKESVYKELEDIPKTDLKKILSKIESLADNPCPTGS
jgi:mRNA interferase RelE/StbE